MEIKHEDSGSKGSFYIEINNSRKASMTYSNAGTDKMIIDHTEVGLEMKGMNAGYQLVLAAVNYARMHNKKIIPLCPFANSVFKKKTELQDVLFNQ